MSNLLAPYPSGRGLRRMYSSVRSQVETASLLEQRLAFEAKIAKLEAQIAGLHQQVKQTNERSAKLRSHSERFVPRHHAWTELLLWPRVRAHLFMLSFSLISCALLLPRQAGVGSFSSKGFGKQPLVGEMDPARTRHALGLTRMSRLGLSAASAMMALCLERRMSVTFCLTAYVPLTHKLMHAPLSGGNC